MGLMERRNCYGRNDFKKDRRGITYHIEETASCRIDNFETVIWGIEVVPAVACLSCKGTEPKLPQTGDNINPWLYVGIGLAAIIVGVIVFRKKKK